MKTTLSVKDFAIILRLVEERIARIKYDTRYIIAQRRAQEKNEHYFDLESVSYDEIEEKISTNMECQSLRHLYDALGELQVEVQTPDVEIKDKQ